MSESIHTTERSHSLWKFLQSPVLYNGFQKCISRKESVDFITKELWKIEPGMKVVDIGCGPGNLRHLFPESISYYGFDPSEEYINQARETFPGDSFHVGTMESFYEEFGSELDNRVDVVTSSGVLHHVPAAEMARILEITMKILKPDSERFAAIEPTYLVKQDKLSRWVLSRDRGMSILFDHQWRELFDEHFSKVSTRVINGLLRIPYSHMLIKAYRVK